MIRRAGDCLRQTNVPQRRRRLTYPSFASSPITLLIVMRDTPNSLHSSISLASLAPSSSPEILAFIVLKIRLCIDSIMLLPYIVYTIYYI